MKELHNKIEEMIKPILEEYNKEYNKENGTDFKFTKDDISELNDQICEVIDYYIEYTY